MVVQRVKKYVSLPPSAHQHLLAVGGGKFSRGIKVAAEFHRNHSDFKKQGTV
jgi:hypothetical protein